MDNTRLTAYNALLKVEKDGAYSNLTLDAFLTKTKFDARDKSFVSALFYGVIERKITLDYNISLYLSKPLKKLKKEVLVLLRLGAYQILYMDKVPSSAAVNESVKLSKKCGQNYASGLINAVLRKVDSQGLKLPVREDTAEYLSVKYSCNKWICEKWLRQFGYDVTVGILESAQGSPDLFIRVNTTKISADLLSDLLEKEGIVCEKTPLDNALKIILGGKAVEDLDEYKKGYFHVQDLASQYCAKALDAKKGDVVFDLCSAPGGKAYTTAENMENSGKVLCFDIHSHRVELIEKGAKRLGLDIIKGAVSDATVYKEEIGFADRVLCDVPCSGLGIIRRKPEIKYKSEDEVASLPQVQYTILTNGARYVKNGGKLVYSTCTLSEDENEKICERFLSEHKDFKPLRPLEEITDDYFVNLLPHKNRTDGFFIACFEKVE